MSTKMTHPIQEITAKFSALPEPMQQEVFNFIEFMQTKVTHQTLPSKHEPALLSEQALASDWNQPEEDKAWIAIDDAELKPAKNAAHLPHNLQGK